MPRTPLGLAASSALSVLVLAACGRSAASPAPETVAVVEPPVEETGGEEGPADATKEEAADEGPKVKMLEVDDFDDPTRPLIVVTRTDFALSLSADERQVAAIGKEELFDRMLGERRDRTVQIQTWYNVDGDRVAEITHRLRQLGFRKIRYNARVH